MIIDKERTCDRYAKLNLISCELIIFKLIHY